MFGRLMNSYYYGKSGKGDYRKEDLPKNRWQLFWEMLRVRLSGICRVNLMTCILWIPMMLVIMSLLINPIVSANDIRPVADEATGNSYIALVYDPVTNEAGEVVSEGLITPLSGVMSTFFLFLFPCILITGPAQAGMAYVMRNWARDEHAFPWSDFKDAVKDNWKQALGISAITGLLPYIVYVAYNFYSQMQTDKGMFFMLPQMLVIVVAVVWILALVFFYPLMVSYRMSFGQLIKNGFVLAIGRLPFVIAIRAAALLPAIIAIAVMFLSNSWLYALLALAAYYIFIGNGLSRFIFASFTNGVFDKFINSHIEGVQINRGLAQEEEDDFEEEEEEDMPSANLPQ
ncbi:MAG: YesL family protein [Clostridia bacterium]|nr:YesL family protein [Clostridia bacterium]